MTQKKERWATRLGLVLAMAGNAVGLGNFLRFPAEAARNGGGAFLIPYIVALLIMGLPLMWVEWSMGRYGGQFGHHSTPGILQSMGRSRFWKYFGVFGLWTNLVVAAYYCYIESWTLAYAGYALVGGFSDTGGKAFFDWLTGETPNQILAFSAWGLLIFLSRGLAKGIELVAKIGMPLLIVFAAVLAVRGLMIDPATDAAAKASPLEGLNFVWQPKFDKLSNPAVWLAAAGQIFFTLSIGLGSIHCYSSYLREKDDVALTGATTAWTNELCEVVLGGTILIPIAVAYLGLNDVINETKGGSGFSLGFFVFPTLFQKWGALAPAAGFMWFGLLFFAAITSSLAMGQPIMAFLQDEYGMNRRRTALAFGAMVLPLAAAVALLTQKCFFDEFNYWAGTLALVVFALGETILFAWVFGMDKGWAEMSKGAELKVPLVFYYIIKYVTPLFLLIILVGYIFQPAAGWETYIQALFSGQSLPPWEWSGDGMIGKLLYKDLPIAPDAKEEQKTFTQNLITLRTIDRLVMVAVFGFFSYLVYRAWARRRAEGRA
jgi:SNF family Na+-dependent transporter